MSVVAIRKPLEVVALPCVAHRRHGPANLTTELHHVIPVGWQQEIVVPAPPFPGRDQAGRGPLWDCRTVALCPTGHRNVHWWLVKLMRAASAAGSDDPLVSYKAARPRLRAPAEFAIAYDALTKFMAETATVQGSLLALCRARQWGMA